MCEEEFWREHFIRKVERGEPVYAEEFKEEGYIDPTVQAKMDEWNKEAEEKEAKEEAERLLKALKSDSSSSKAETVQNKSPRESNDSEFEDVKL